MMVDDDGGVCLKDGYSFISDFEKGTSFVYFKTIFENVNYSLHILHVIA